MHQSRTRRRGATIAVAAALLAVSVIGASPAAAADRPANPSNFESVFDAAQPGDRVVLASGDYGMFTGAMKPGVVTITAAPGATAQMELQFRGAANIAVDGLRLGDIELSRSSTRNITVRNSYITGQTVLRTGDLQNANVLFDSNVHAAWDKCDGCGEGRVWLPQRTSQPSGITIQNSRFGPGGDSDGIQNGSNATRILNNEFVGLRQLRDGRAHVDSIQLYGSQNTVIQGNYFHDSSVHIMAPDGGDHELITDNVFVATRSYRSTIQLGSHEATRFEHNTVRNATVHMDSKGGNEPSTGGILRDNVMMDADFNLHNGSGCSGCTVDNNLSDRAVFVGGSDPGSYAGHKLAAGSPGVRAATDGTDQGARIGVIPGPPSNPGGPGAPADPGGGTGSGGGGAGRDGGGSATNTGAGAPGAGRPSVRMLSSRRALLRRGRLRLRVRARSAGTVALTLKIRPKGRRRARPIGLRSAVLRFSEAGTRTVSRRVSTKARRRLRRWRKPRLVVRSFAGAERERRTGRVVLKVRAKR